MPKGKLILHITDEFADIIFSMRINASEIVKCFLHQELNALRVNLCNIFTFESVFKIVNS